MSITPPVRVHVDVSGPLLAAACRHVVDTPAGLSHAAAADRADVTLTDARELGAWAADGPGARVPVVVIGDHPVPWRVRAVLHHRPVVAHLPLSTARRDLVDTLLSAAGGAERTRMAGPEAVVATSPRDPWRLTQREAEIMMLISSGLSNQEIATRCYLSINTVKTYTRAAYRKAGVTTRPAAVVWALANGFAVAATPVA